MFQKEVEFATPSIYFCQGCPQENNHTHVVVADVSFTELLPKGCLVLRVIGIGPKAVT